MERIAAQFAPLIEETKRLVLEQYLLAMAEQLRAAMPTGLPGFADGVEWAAGYLELTAHNLTAGATSGAGGRRSARVLAGARRPEAEARGAEARRRLEAATEASIRRTEEA